VPNFTTKLPKQGKHQGYDIKRTPTSTAMTAIITCENLAVCDTHYWNGRTSPCERIVNEEGKTLDDSPCPACIAKQAWRTHVYVSAFLAKTHEHIIFECTANAAKPLEEYFQATGTLRGCIINAIRPKGGPNSKVVITTNTANLTKVNLPQPPDLIRALAVIWRLPKTALTTQNEQIDRPYTENECKSNVSHVRPNADILHDMHCQPDNAESPPDFAARRATIISQLETAAHKKNGRTKTCLAETT
jgi:hypothetical protein